MRLFIAVDLDAPARRAVEEAVAQLRDRAECRVRGLSRSVAWVAPRNLHITLHFIGDMEDGRLGVLRDALARPLDLGPPRIRLSGWGVFPARGAPRVIWIGVTDGAEALTRAHQLLKPRLEDAGIGTEARPWFPHVTIGRARTPFAPAWRELVTNAAATPACEWAVSQCTLYRSHLSSGAPTYEALSPIPFSDCAAPRPPADQEDRRAT